MNKPFLAALVVALFLQSCSGETLYERSFAEMGQESFTVEGSQQTACQEIQFLFPKDIDITSQEAYPIASIGLGLGPVKEGKMDANISLNGKQIASLEAKNFKCGESLCWERIQMPKKLLKGEENTLQACLATGNSITRITLDSSSKLGLYKAADFLGKEAFTTTAEKESLVIGEKTTITIVLHNEGGGSALAEIKFARPLAEDKNAFSVVEGQTYFSGIVGPGEKTEISYVVKPRIAATMTLPPAIAYYQNEFGEQESMFSNLVTLNVRQPEKKIEAFIVKQGETAIVGQAIPMQLAIKNIGSDPLYDLGIELESEAGLGQQQALIDSIMPKETRMVGFTAMNSKPGEFEIGCTITYIDQNLSQSSCQKSFVEFREQEIGPAIYAAIALVAVALAAYAYIMRP